MLMEINKTTQLLWKLNALDSTTTRRFRFFSCFPEANKTIIPAHVLCFRKTKLQSIKTVVPPMRKKKRKKDQR